MYQWFAETDAVNIYSDEWVCVINILKIVSQPTQQFLRLTKVEHCKWQNETSATCFVWLSGTTKKPILYKTDKRLRAAGYMKLTHITTPEMAEINNVSTMQKAEVFMATVVLIFTNTIGFLYPMHQTDKCQAILWASIVYFRGFLLSNESLQLE